MALLTIPEAAEYLRCSRPMVYKLIRTSGLPCVRVGSDKRIRQQDLDQWLESRVEK